VNRLTIAGFAALGLFAALAAADRAHPPDLTRARAVSRETVDRDGVLLRPFLAKDDAWRLATTVDDVGPRYIALLKAYEDRRFDSHFGVDPPAVLRAAFQLARAGRIVSGASTLTMQVARLLEPRPRGIAAKLVQSARAVQLELRYSKEEILSFYLTLAPMGGNLEGVRAASLAYFGKEPKSLTLAEAALLVALPQSPERLRPDRHWTAARAGRDKVVARLAAQGAIGRDDADEALAAGVPAARLPMPLMAPHLAGRLVADANAPRIVTTIDARLQRGVEHLIAREARFLDDDASLAVVVVKTDSREILAYAGGKNYWGAAGQIDLARARRSPGSALKPLIYGMAFDDLALHPATLMQDTPQIFGDYAPQNFDRGFQGTVSVRDALRMSLNVPAVMVLERVGPVRFTLALEHAGAAIAFPERDSAPTLPVALGGLGISLHDLTMLYAAVAAGGEARPLRATPGAPDGAPFRLFGAKAAYYLRDVLSGAALPDGWAMGQGLARPRMIAFKTGTSYGFRDAWAVGFSNDYTVGVWAGRPDGAPRPGRFGRNEAAPVLLKIFDLLPADRHVAPTPPKDAIVASRNEELPASLRQFARAGEARRTARAARVPPPAIAFPPDGATVPLSEAGDPDPIIALKAEGGRSPLTWLVDGRIVGRYDRFARAGLTPDGEGFARITVVDAEGRSATSRIRFKRPH